MRSPRTAVINRSVDHRSTAAAGRHAGGRDPLDGAARDPGDGDDHGTRTRCDPSWRNRDQRLGAGDDPDGPADAEPDGAAAISALTRSARRPPRRRPSRSRRGSSRCSSSWRAARPTGRRPLVSVTCACCPGAFGVLTPPRSANCEGPADRPPGPGGLTAAMSPAVRDRWRQRRAGRTRGETRAEVACAPGAVERFDPAPYGLGLTARRLLRLWREQRRLSLIGLAYAFVYSALSLIIPVLVARAIDRSIVHHREPLAPLLAAIVVLALARGGVNFLRRYATSRVGIGIEARLASCCTAPTCASRVPSTTVSRPGRSCHGRPTTCTPSATSSAGGWCRRSRARC